eukprot:Nk52_evm1s238 gene=Nk52_evmTU1s238
MIPPHSSIHYVKVSDKFCCQLRLLIYNCKQRSEGHAFFESSRGLLSSWFKKYQLEEIVSLLQRDIRSTLQACFVPTEKGKGTRVVDSKALLQICNSDCVKLRQCEGFQFTFELKPATFKTQILTRRYREGKLNGKESFRETPFYIVVKVFESNPFEESRLRGTSSGGKTQYDITSFLERGEGNSEKDGSKNNPNKSDKKKKKESKSTNGGGNSSSKTITSFDESLVPKWRDKVRSLSEKKLHKHFKKVAPSLVLISRGTVYSRRHTLYNQTQEKSNRNKTRDLKLSCGSFPFTQTQHNFLTTKLMDMFCKSESVRMRFFSYVMDVLLPECCAYILMNVLDISFSVADLLIIYSGSLMDVMEEENKENYPTGGASCVVEGAGDGEAGCIVINE